MSARPAEQLRVVIAGGGTGGHVFPALAIKQAIVQQNPQARVIFVGTRRGLEAQVMPREKEDLCTLWISGFSRQHMLQNLLLPLKLAASFAQSLSLMSSFKPHVVIGTGGYVMGPVLWMAQRLGLPTLVQEQNSFPGYTTRKLAARAGAICVGFEDARKRLPGSARIEVTGNPLRSSFHTVQRADARQRWPLDPSRKTILVFGGSAGARSINEAIAHSLDALLDSCNLIWQTGRLGIPATANRPLIDTAVKSGRLMILEFIEDMPGAYAVSDLAVCRAGAMTLAELAMAGLPAVLVPYPFATDDHQTANARAVVDCGAAVLIKDAELSRDALTTAAQRALEAETLSDMARNMKALARPDAAERIARIAISLAGK